ncbi:MAG: hypothetical protein K2L31_04385, partial [Muribaculum sp.]|nr:hypothetical protein [Muribaculum sp.]
ANVNQYHVSIDGEHFQPLGSPFETEAHDWKGNHIGVYCYTTDSDDGKARFDYFRYTHDGPASLPLYPLVSLLPAVATPKACCPQ